LACSLCVFFCVICVCFCVLLLPPPGILKASVLSVRFFSLDDPAVRVIFGWWVFSCSYLFCRTQVGVFPPLLVLRCRRLSSFVVLFSSSAFNILFSTMGSLCLFELIPDGFFFFSVSPSLPPGWFVITILGPKPGWPSGILLSVEGLEARVSKTSLFMLFPNKCYSTRTDRFFPFPLQNSPCDNLTQFSQETKERFPHPF